MHLKHYNSPFKTFVSIYAHCSINGFFFVAWANFQHAVWWVYLIIYPMPFGTLDEGWMCREMFLNGLRCDSDSNSSHGIRMTPLWTIYIPAFVIIFIWPSGDELLCFSLSAWVLEGQQDFRLSVILSSLQGCFLSTRYTISIYGQWSRVIYQMLLGTRHWFSWT